MLAKVCKQITVDTINVNITYSAKRRTIALSVCRDSSVKVDAPYNVSTNIVTAFIETKRQWILKKIEFFKNYQQAIPIKRLYISGEEFHYLGTAYTLQISSGKHSIDIDHTTKTIDIAMPFPHDSKIIKNYLLKFLKAQSTTIFNERLVVCHQIFTRHYHYKQPHLTIRKMRAKWGSILTNANCMTLNLHLIHSPLHCIDYVIFHELCHLKYKGHGKRFYRLQGEFVPNWKDIKKELNSFNGYLRDVL